MFPVLLLSIWSVSVDRLSLDIVVVITDKNVSVVSIADTEAYDCEATSEFVDKVISLMTWDGTVSDVWFGSVKDESIPDVTADEAGLLVSGASVNHVLLLVSFSRDEVLLESELASVGVCLSIK